MFASVTRRIVVLCLLAAALYVSDPKNKKPYYQSI
jgi:hypothetical protein